MKAEVSWKRLKIVNNAQLKPHKNWDEKICNSSFYNERYEQIQRPRQVSTCDYTHYLVTINNSIFMVFIHLL